MTAKGVATAAAAVAGILVAAAGVALAVSARGDEREAESWKPGPAVPFTDSSPEQSFSYRHTVFNNGTAQVRAEVTFRFNQSVLEGRDNDEVIFDTQLFVEGEKATYGMNVGFDLMGRASERDRLTASFTVPPGGHREVEARVTISKVQQPPHSTWLAQYDPLEFVVETRTPTTAMTPALSGLALYAAGFSAFTASILRLPGRRPGPH